MLFQRVIDQYLREVSWSNPWIFLIFKSRNFILHISPTGKTDIPIKLLHIKNCSFRNWINWSGVCSFKEYPIYPYVDFHDHWCNCDTFIFYLNFSIFLKRNYYHLNYSNNQIFATSISCIRLTYIWNYFPMLS